MADLASFTFTPEDDIAYSSSGWDIAADESVSSLAGDDTINGDQIEDRDDIFFEKGIYNLGTIETNTGNDSLVGSGVFNGIVNGGTINTGEGNDHVSGTGTSVFTGISNYGQIDTGTGNDQMLGIGKTLGIYNSGTIVSGEGDDELRGEGSTSVGIDNDSSGEIDTSSGNDSVFGTSATDSGIDNYGLLNTGDGNDHITGEGTNGIISTYSLISTGNGDDLINGDGSTIYGISLGGGTINGGLGDDTIQGSGGEDGIHTYFTGTEINSDSGKDYILGTGARHGIYHFAGTISGGDGNDTIKGVDNNDTIFLSDDAFGTDSGIQNWSVIDGGSGDDLIIGEGFAVGIDNRGTIYGGDGNDTINAINGGFQGYGHIDLGNGDDIVKGFGSGSFAGGNGTDAILLPTGTYTISNSSVRRGGMVMDIAGFEKVGGFDGDLISLQAGTFIVSANGTGSFQQSSSGGDPTPQAPPIPEDTQPVPEVSIPPITDSPVPILQSPVLGISPQEIVRTVPLSTPISVRNLQFTQAVVGTPLRDVIIGSDEGEVITGGGGKNQMTGGGGPDAFLFETPGKFGKMIADIITDFDSDEGDVLAVSQQVFTGLNRIRFKSVEGKRDTKQAGRTYKNFIYNEKNGILYYDGNGKKNGWGEGGEFVKLLDTPEIGKADIAII